MKTSIEKTGSLGRKLSIEVPTEMVNSAFDRVYKGIQKNANIKGFRKGKAPLNMVKSIYADRVKQDVLQELIGDAYEKALTEHKLLPISQPQVHFDLLDAEQPFKFTAEFEIRPEVQIKKMDNLKVEKEALDISDEKVESVLTQIRESRAQIVPVFEQRPARLGDIAEIDFVGTVDGKPLEGGSMSGYKLELGSGQFIPGFEDGVVGMAVSASKTLNLKFPDEYGHKEIAGKAVQFEVTLKGLHKKDLPALNDEWVKSMGSGQSSVEELKKAIREDITETEGKRINDELKNRLLRALVQENPVEVPPSLREQQKNLLLSDVEKRMKSQGLSEADLIEYQAKWAKDFDDTASFMVQSSFLIDAIAKQQGLEATDEDVQARLEKYAKQTGIEMAKIKDFYLNNSQRLNQMEYQITEEKVVQFLVGKADIKEVPRSKLSTEK